ncbi:MAG: DUF1640 domain-containing protein [Pseudomonadota bacterium]|nr:DUF1640 domain-containing protein [Pseudomonadota bacterium]MDP1902830.1 DUF1640 domain-containing protein [Pseudomonadota bacterium]MDP2353430.1 DUF1640 domain-containing protein [Pseudomonadota bacterium]
MSTVTFDTHDFVRRLIEAVVRVVTEAQSDLATRRDLADLRLELQRDLRELEYRMTIKLGGLMIAAVGIVATLVKLL